MSRTPPPSAPTPAPPPAVQAAGKDVVPRFDLERAQLRMRTIETAAIFRRENTPVEMLLANAEKLFAWVVGAADKNSGDPS